MNNKTISTLIIAVVVFLTGCMSGQDRIQSESQVNLKNNWDSISYFIGLSLGYSMEGTYSEVVPALVASGMNTVLSDSSAYDPQTVQMMMQQLTQDLMASKSKEDVKFLEENKKREGVFETETGLQYEPLEEGDGPMPTDTSTVTVHYHGTLVDGTVFDSSVERGEPATFPLNRVIPGWTEGLQLMSVGSKYKFYIPSELAYGQRPPSQAIPPNAVLIFEVELLSIGEGE